MIWVIAGIIALFALLLVVGAEELEQRYNKTHPPDDGTREERFDDEQP